MYQIDHTIQMTLWNNQIMIILAIYLDIKSVPVTLWVDIYVMVIQAGLGQILFVVYLLPLTGQYNSLD